MERFNIDDEVLFQAYEENDAVKGKVKRVGTLLELNRAQLHKDDNRIFHEVRTKNFLYLTTGEHLKLIVK